MDKNENQLGDLIKQFAGGKKIKANLFQKRIETNWEKLFGKSIAQYTRSIKLREGTLSLSIDSSSLREELHMGREKIKAIVNAELGEEYVNAVRIKP